MVEFNLLFVCAGNVCRSPSAAALARAAAQQTSDAISVESAGVAAAVGAPWCDRAQSLVTGRRGVGKDGLIHHARQIEESMLAAADLVLTADRMTATALLTRWPGYRDRVFPLSMAGPLAADVATRRDHLSPADMVAAMNGARGRVPIPPERSWPKRRSMRRLVLPTNDLPDPHAPAPPVAHDPVVRATVTATLRVMEPLLAVVGAGDREALPDLADHHNGA